MSTPFSQFCDQVVRRVRWFPARGAIAAELRAHLEDHAAALMERGTPEEEAAQRALEAMGDPEELGRQLNRAHPPLLCFSVLVTNIILTLLFIAFSFALISQVWNAVTYYRHDREFFQEVTADQQLHPMDEWVEIDGLRLHFHTIFVLGTTEHPFGYEIYLTCDPSDGWLPDNSSTRLEMNFVENVPGNVFYRFVTDTGWEYIPATSLNSGVSRWIILPQLPPEDAEHLWLEGDVFGHTFRVEFPIVRGGDLP